MSRKVNWGRLILAFLVACFLFSFGLFIGYLAKGIIENVSLDVVETTKTELSNLETLQLLEDQHPCNSFTLDRTSERLDYLGGLITNLEQKKSKSDAQVLEIKKLYTLLEVRHMLLIKEKKNSCGQNSSIFLFFYSNKKVLTIIIRTFFYRLLIIERSEIPIFIGEKEKGLREFYVPVPISPNQSLTWCWFCEKYFCGAFQLSVR